jgi:hypothetical protein
MPTKQREQTTTTHTVMRNGQIETYHTRVYQVAPHTTADLCPDCRLAPLRQPVTARHLTHAEYVDAVGAHDD